MELDRPLVSVVVTSHTYSSANLDALEQTLSSIAAQTCREHEIVLVDQGSAAAVETLARRYEPLVLVRQPGTGAAARNAGIAASRGDYFVFAEPGDLLLPAAIETGLRELERHPDCGFVLAPCQDSGGSGTAVSPAPQPSVPSDVYRALLAFEWPLDAPSSALFRRTVIDRLIGFREPSGVEFLDFCLRAAKAFPGHC